MLLKGGRNLIKAKYTTSDKNQPPPSSAKGSKYIKKYQNLITDRTCYRVGDGGPMD